jgi:hypothetical protein
MRIKASRNAISPRMQRSSVTLELCQYSGGEA